MSQEGHDTSHDSEMRASRTPTDVRTAGAMEAGTSYDTSNRSPRGTLSDAAIAELGAMPGASAGSLLNSNGAPLSSKNILTIALQKAQNAVQLDSANHVPEAIAAYKQAVRLLEEVMERIAPRGNKRSRPTREEERRRLRVIHDTYADRIRLLSMIYSPDVGAIDEMEDAGYGYTQQQAATRADWLDRVRDDSQHSPIITTPRLDDDFMGMNAQRSPQVDTRSFLSVTPASTALSDSSSYAATQQAPSSQSQLPFPRSPPVPNAPLSPEAGAINTSPRRRVREHARVNSRESHSSRVSVSLSIADEQDAQQYRLPPPVIAEETPLISIDDALSEKAKKRLSSPRKEQLRDAVSQVRESEVLLQQHGRSDSDISFKSTNTGSRLKPVSSLPHRAFGLDDEVRTPNTPYFDASAGASISPVDPQKPQPELPLPPLPDAPSEAPSVDPPAEKPAKMGFAQRARALSFKGPLLRQKVSMPSLGERKKDDGTAANGAAVPAVPSLRPGLNRMPSSGALPASRDHPTPWDDLPGPDSNARSSSNRPRAATSAAALVSASTAAGTISQRRKGAQVEDPSVRGLSDELQELGLAHDAGSYEDGGAKSIATTNRQRSASQSGSRRPSIPAAFVAANGIASAANGESIGEELLPPVPDLARTLSALERKRVSDDRALATATGAEVSHSTLAMPLPRPRLPESEAVDDISSTRTFLITDIFPTGLPSLAAGAPSYASAPLSSPSPLSPTLPTSAHPLLKPFLTLTLLRASILSGSQLTPTLYLPRDIWRQPGAKLVGIETKLRAIELLLSGLDSLERAGEPLLLPLGTGAGLETSSGTRWLRALDEWESVLGDVQSMLSKKLPFLDAAGGVKKSGLGSRFTRSIDRMTGAVGQVKSVDAAQMGAYADGLVRLGTKSALLGTHLHWILAADGTLPPPSSTAGSVEVKGALQSPTGVGTAHTNRTAYFALPAQMREDVKARLKRSSEFMGKVVLVWVLQDVGVLVERRMKKAGGVFGD
uniref:Uncharacterized protein n=2 Tax=Kalmanozyma brasiliensis (strain GHG001) TaxID=1365824 RepID=V5EWL3_KALBG